MRVNLLALLLLTLLLSGSAGAVDSWYNASWHYRFSLFVNSNNSVRSYWPVQRDLNFTSMLAGLNDNSPFDNNSLRVAEYNSTGSLLYFVPYQFDEGPGYNPASNAVGTLTFLMNGTTPAQTVRYYQVYFDDTAHGPKPIVGYTSNLNASITSQYFSVNNSLLQVYGDTDHGQNTSGIYIVTDSSGQNFDFDDEVPLTSVEFQRFNDGNGNELAFNFTNDTFIEYAGPIRVVIEQVGNETYFNDPDNYTGFGRMVKTYTFYENNSWVRVDQNLTNTGPSPVTWQSDNSTAEGLDPQDAYSFGGSIQLELNQSAAAPWAWAADHFGNVEMGIINIGQTGTTDYVMSNDWDNTNFTGVSLNPTTVAAGGSITDDAAIMFNPGTLGSIDPQGVQNLSVELSNPETNPAISPEAWNVTALSQTDHQVYNLGETVTVFANVTNDAYSIATSANATVDNGTPANTSNYFNLTLIDQGLVGGDHIFSNTFNLTEGSVVGPFNVTIRVYNGTTLLAATNFTIFNTTNIYGVDVDVLNPNGLVSRQVNASISVQNFRGDQYIPGALVSCSYNGTGVAPSNITDLGNGTYMATFPASAQFGIYQLACNATKLNNFGNGTGLFSTESLTTNVTQAITPASVTVNNVTLTQSNWFVFTTNASNIGNGTAASMNISLILPPGWSSNASNSSCGSVGLDGGWCMASFNVTVAANTSPGTYYPNVSATRVDPDGAKDSSNSSIQVNVSATDILSVLTSSLSGYGLTGAQSYIGNFFVTSLGNDFLSNLNFSTTNLSSMQFTFTPSNFTALGPGGQLNVSVNLTLPQGFPTGNYTGWVNVTDSNGNNSSLPINITVEATNVSISSTPTYFVASNVTTYSNNSFIELLNSSNLGNVTAFAVNLSLQVPAGWATNLSSFQCGNLNPGANCTQPAFITVQSGTLAGNYTLNSSVSWYSPLLGAQSNSTQLIVNVSSTFALNVTPRPINGTAFENQTTTAANFTIISQGSDNLQGITYGLLGFNFSTLIFDNVTNLTAQTSQQVFINATVPWDYPAGVYNGTLQVNTSNAANLSVPISITVAANRTWTIDTTTCTRLEEPDTGTVCTANINNTGNVPINFTFLPPSGNHTAVSNSSFILQELNSTSVTFTYNFSGIGKTDINTTYFINTTPAANPQNATVIIEMTTFNNLNVSVAAIPSFAQATAPVPVFVNVTDANNVGIANVTVNVTGPLGGSTLFNLTEYNITLVAGKNLTMWEGVINSTAATGIYTLYAFAQDNDLVNGSDTGYLNAYADMESHLYTLSSTYSLGSLATIYYQALDAGGVQLSGVNASFKVVDNESRTIFDQNYSDINGVISPLPTFSIASDEQSGQYTLYENGTYYDSGNNETVNETNNYTFDVVGSNTAGIIVTVNTEQAWAPGQNATFLVKVTDSNGNLLDPDTLNFSAYSPDNTLFTLQKSDLAHLSTGYYEYNLTVPADASEDTYLADANASYQSLDGRGLAVFSILSALNAQLSTSTVWFPQNIMTFTISTLDGSGSPTDINSLNLTVYNPANSLYFSTNLGSFTQNGTGLYTFAYAMPLGTATGVYTAVLQASTADGSHTQTTDEFQVSAGGPFDAILNIPTPEVSPGQDLGFTLTLKNMGSVSEDVGVAYAVTDENNQTWYSTNEVVYVPAQGTNVYTRQAYIFDSQPLGTYTLTAVVTYDPNQPAAVANSTFEVVTPSSSGNPSNGGNNGNSGTGSTSNPTPIPTPNPSVSAQALDSIQIIDFPQSIVAQHGQTVYPSITVENTGLEPVHNLQLFVQGVPVSWVTVNPPTVNVLQSGDEETFVATIAVPEDAPASVLQIGFSAISDEAKDDQTSQLAIFQSEADLVQYEIQQLQAEIAQLTKDTQDAAAVGKDVSQVWPVIDEASNYTQLATTDLESLSLDNALGDTEIAGALVSKATGLLTAAPFAAPASGNVLSWWEVAILLIATVAICILIFLYYERRKKKEAPAGTPPPTTAAQADTAVTMLKAKSDDELEDERDRISRAIAAIDNSIASNPGLKRAYSELRKRNEERLSQVQRAIMDRRRAK